MTEKNFHTVMELAEKVGVPRTTINDWLAKFSQFAEFSMQGKRRVYSDSTLSVLLKISELRTAGKSSFEIEQELTRLYAVHPEAAEEPEEEKSMPAEEKPGSGEPFPDASANALVVKQQTDELARLLGAGFQDIRGRMEALESKAHRNAVRSWFFFALASVLILLMSFGGLLVYRHALDRKESDRNRDAALTELTAQSSALREGNADLKEQLKNLRTGMDTQREEFDRMLRGNQENFEKRREAELAAQRDRFAAEKLEQLKTVESLQRTIREKEKELQEKEDAVRKQQKAGEDAVRRIREENERALRERDEQLKKAKAEADYYREQNLLNHPAFRPFIRMEGK